MRRGSAAKSGGKTVGEDVLQLVIKQTGNPLLGDIWYTLAEFSQRGHAPAYGGQQMLEVCPASIKNL